MIILAIETSCDETAIAVIKTEKAGFSVLSEAVSSQVKLHAGWGGVVPNLAAREHLKNIMPMLCHSLKKSGIKHDDIDLIAVTSGPGLIPALLIGNNAAKTLSWLWRKPLLGINHIEGHIYSNFINKIGEISKSQFSISKKISKSKLQNSKIKFPILCLIVSGGHTQLVLAKSHLKYKIIGETLDDAAGEAFDKVARILGLGYPGGPAIAAEAAKLKVHPPRKKKLKFNFPRPMMNSNDFNFSFSGLKTAVLYEVRKLAVGELAKLKSEICKEFQQAAIDVLIAKTLKAAFKFKPKTVMLAGGVSANRELRKQLGRAVRKNLKSTGYRIPETGYSIDNASMIASAAYYRWQKMSRAQKNKCSGNWKGIRTDANLKLV